MQARTLRLRLRGPGLRFQHRFLPECVRVNSQLKGGIQRACGNPSPSVPIYSRSRSGKGCPEAASEKQVRLPGPHRLTMGRHWLLVCAVALAADVAQEVEELARRRLSKLGVVFLEDDDAVNIQSCSVSLLDSRRWRLRRLDAVDAAARESKHAGASRKYTNTASASRPRPARRRSLRRRVARRRLAARARPRPRR